MNVLELSKGPIPTCYDECLCQTIEVSEKNNMVLAD